MAFELNAQAVHGFTVGLLAAGFDDPKPIPPFHMDMWELCTDLSKPYVSIAAPRGHAKSTAITLSYTLAMSLFGVRDFTLLLSDTYDQSVEFLADIRVQVQDNDALRETFDIQKIVRGSEDDLIVQHRNGYMWRIRARGAEQAIRGLKWRNKRPNHFVYDDVENDGIVMNPQRREKFRNWVLRQVLPAGSGHAIHRWVGTILHEDSMLARLLADPNWASLKFRAHRGISDFSDILWPEQFDAARLQAIKAGYAEQRDLEGYSQEYLNEPVAEGETYFRREDLLPMRNADHEAPKVYFAAADFAIAEHEKADYTVMMVAGMAPDGTLHIVDGARFRGDADEIINRLIDFQRKYDKLGGLAEWTFETEKIDKALGPSLNRAMRSAGVFLTINKVTPTKDKPTRGRSIQRMVRSGSVRFNERMTIYNALIDELMTMTDGGSRGAHADCFDAFAYLGLAAARMYEAKTFEEQAEDEYEEELEMYGSMFGGVSAVTGY